MEIVRSPEIEAVVRRLWSAFGSGSGSTFANLTSRHPAARFILAADDLWLDSSDGTVEYMTERGRLIGVARIEQNRSEAWQAGEVGWFAAEITSHLVNGESVTFRQTAVLVIEDGVWHVIQIHTSQGVPPEQTFGDSIAAALDELVNSLTESHRVKIAAAAGSTGLVTLMFTDVEDSTRMAAERGDTEWVALMQNHFEAIGRSVTVSGGTVVKTLGDGAMAAFSTPRGAAESAIAIQHSSGDQGLRVRIGIHTGEAVAVGSDYAGTTVAKAARIASAADGGEVLLSSTTRELLAPYDFRFGDERTAELKGLPGTHRLIPLL